MVTLSLDWMARFDTYREAAKRSKNISLKKAKDLLYAHIAASRLEICFYLQPVVSPSELHHGLYFFSPHSRLSLHIRFISFLRSLLCKKKTAEGEGLSNQLVKKVGPLPEVQYHWHEAMKQSLQRCDPLSS